MAVFREIEDRGVKVILGKYEGEEYQDDLKFLEEDLAKKIVDFPLKRQKEILMTRRILRQFLPNYQLFYRVDGAPYLVPENKYISISHSFPWVAVAVSCEKIGIDLEKKTRKNSTIKIQISPHF